MYLGEYFKWFSTWGLRGGFELWSVSIFVIKKLVVDLIIAKFYIFSLTDVLHAYTLSLFMTWK